MARPYTGAWVRSRMVPYAGTNVWGTGINPVHSRYGAGPPLRVTGRDEAGHTSPAGAVPDSITGEILWGYELQTDTSADYVTYDGRPNLGVDTEAWRGNAGDMPSLNATGMQKTAFRSMMDGAHRYAQKLVNVLPSETVTEGWRNKARGAYADALVSDPSQYEMQTSMRQRYQERTNTASVSRATDEPRAGIASRLAGQKLKIYSGGERHWDMYPREQNDIPRAFYYRTAGTGRQGDMLPNDMFVQEPIQRVPSPDPPLGASETDFADPSASYGYSPEDNFYA